MCSSSCDAATIGGALALVPTTLTGYTCVVITDGATYSEQVNVRNFNMAGSSLTITADPLSGLRPVVSPGATSTAAFVIANDSVNIIGLDIVPTNTMPYGIITSSAYITISSVNVKDAGGLISFAGVSLSSWNAVSNSSVTVASSFAKGFYIASASMTTISYSRVQNDGTFRHAVYLDSTASSTTLTGNYLNGGVFIDGRFNTIVQSTINAHFASFSAVSVRGSSHTIADSYITDDTVDGISIGTVASYITVIRSTIVVNSLNAAIYVNNSSYTRLVQNVASNANAQAAAIYIVQGTGHSISRSSLTGVAYGLYIWNSSSNTVDNSFVHASSGVIVKASTNTVFNANFILASNSTGDGVALITGNSGLSFAGNTIFGGAQGYGLRLEPGNSGLINLSTNAILGARFSLSVDSPVSGARVWVSSNTIYPTLSASFSTIGLSFSGLVSGATVQYNEIAYRTAGASNLSYGIAGLTSSGLIIQHNRIINPGMATSGNIHAAFFSSALNSVFNFNDVYSIATGVSQTSLLTANASSLTIKNNIFYSSFTATVSSATIWSSASTLSSDYNDFYSQNALNTLVLNGTSAQFSSGWLGLDANSLAVDPLWASLSLASEDFHPKSSLGRYNPATGLFVNDAQTSTTIDRADPAEDYSLEPSPNGSRANMGSYGATAQASKGGFAPTSPTVSEVSLSSITVTYGLTGAVSYLVEASTASDFSGTLISSVTTSATVASLAPQGLSLNTTYYLRAGAISGSTTFYATVTPTASVTLSTTPAPLTFSGIAPSQFTLQWLANGNPSGTVYEASVSTAINFTGPTNLITTTAQSAVFSSLIAGATYFARVRALNWVGVGSPYALGAVVTASGVITIAANRLPSVWYNADTVIFNAQGATNYHYRVSASSSDIATLGDPTFDGSAFTLTMPLGITYFHVLGVDGVGASIGATRFGPIQLDTGTPSVVAITAQASATDPTPIINGGTTLLSNPHFSWTSLASTSPIIGYSYLLSTDPSATPPLTVNTTLSFADASLSSSGLYYFTIRAQNLAGNWGPVGSFSFNYTTTPRNDTIVLRRNYFNPNLGQCASIQVQSATAGHLKVVIYTLLGEKVASLSDQDVGVGTYNYSWCGRNNSQQTVATGVYILHIEAPGQRKDFKLGVAK